MYFLIGGVAERLLGNSEGNIRVARHVEIKHLALVWCRGAEGANDDGGRDRLGGCEELEGQVFLGLAELAWPIEIDVSIAYQIDLCLAAFFDSEYE